MSYFLLSIASLLYGSQFMAVKLYQKENGKTLCAAALFSATSGVIAAVVFFAVNGLKLSFGWFSLCLAVLAAIVNITCTAVGLKALSLGSISVYSLFLMLGGMILPYLAGIIVWHEKVSVYGIAGLVILCLAMILPVLSEKREACPESEKGDKKSRIAFAVLCVALFVLNGASSIIVKVHQMSSRAVDSGSYTILVFLAQSVFGGILFACLKVGKKGDGVTLNRMCILAGLLNAIFNGVASYLNIYSASSVPATAQYPIITGGTLAFSAILGFICYKERPDIIEIIRVAVVISATILFMF